MYICGLDLAKKSAIAVIDEDENIIFLESFMIYEKDEEFGERLIKLNNILMEYFVLFRPTFVGIEELNVPRGMHTNRALMGYRGIAAFACKEILKTEINFLTSSHIRKLVLGKENKVRNKELIKTFLSKKYKRDFDGDEADALAVALCLYKEVKEKVS